MTVPLSLFRKWLEGKKVEDDSGDVLGEMQEESDESIARSKSSRAVLVWRGQASFIATTTNASQIGPNDTIVIPVEFGGWKQLGHIPNATLDPSVDVEMFPAREASQLYQLLFDSSDQEAESKSEPAWRGIVDVDIADEAFFQSRAKSILRYHPKLSRKDIPEKFWKELQDAAKDPESDLNINSWKNAAKKIIDTFKPDDIHQAEILARLTQYEDQMQGQGTVTRYPDGLIWISGRHGELKSGILPIASFGDVDDGLSRSEKVSLARHLADVTQQAETYCNLLQVDTSVTNTTLAAAAGHDLGKADPRFQAMLLGCPTIAAHMQPTLWAKSPVVKGREQSELPKHFRHEMLSLAIVEEFGRWESDIDSSLLLHSIAAHHGYARPWEPVCIDGEPCPVDLKDCGDLVLSTKERLNTVPAYQIDSGTADRFWQLNRKYGWWGLAHCESMLRLADWAASANPGQAGLVTDDKKLLRIGAARSTSPQDGSSLVLSGINGANPLGFLAAIGTFRTLVATIEDLQLHWQTMAGAWRPVLSSESTSLDEDAVIDRLNDYLSKPPQLPLLQEIGPNLTISGEQFRELAIAGVERCQQATSPQELFERRISVDFLAAFGCDLMTADGSPQSSVEDTALRTMSGAGHQHFISFMRELIASTDSDHLRSTLFSPWRYTDAGRGANLRWDPVDDRRYALRWLNPSGDPSQTMRGANRLAIEALPLFATAIATSGKYGSEKLETTGFVSLRRRGTLWTWPIWSRTIGLATCRSLLQETHLRTIATESAGAELAKEELAAMGVQAIFQSQRITTNKFRNFTPAQSI